MLIALQNSVKLTETTFEKILLEYAPLIVAIVGIITLLFGLYQYRKSIIQNRSSVFLDMRNRYMRDVEFQNIFNLLGHGYLDFYSFLSYRIYIYFPKR